MIVYAISKAREGMTVEDLAPFMEEELRYGWGLLKQGVTRAIQLRRDAIGVVITMECESVEEARAHCARFALLQNGIIDFTYIPVEPFSLWEQMPRAAAEVS